MSLEAACGDRAIIGVRDDPSPDGSSVGDWFVRAVDGGPLGSGLDRFEVFIPPSDDSRAPTDCSDLPDLHVTMWKGEVAVNDAP